MNIKTIDKRTGALHVYPDAILTSAPPPRRHKITNAEECTHVADDSHFIFIGDEVWNGTGRKLMHHMDVHLQFDDGSTRDLKLPMDKSVEEVALFLIELALQALTPDATVLDAIEVSRSAIHLRYARGTERHGVSADLLVKSTPQQNIATLRKLADDIERELT